VKTDILKRLYVVTGKGGVGKTTLALAIAKALIKQERKVLYNSFDATPNLVLCQMVGVPVLDLKLDHSVTVYMARKLGSMTIAEWIMKTPFFSSLFAMVPGLGHMILLGHIIDMLEKDPELIIVLDSPSSGHALTMFESPINFGDIFGQGVLAEDIKRMLAFMASPNGIRTIISTLPSAMAVHEGLELKEELERRGLNDFKVVLNEYLPNTIERLHINKADLPAFMAKKCALEEEALQQFEKAPIAIFPFIPDLSPLHITNELCGKAEVLL
jgi:anion-transporting  ArsA/GET3 family ATPase